MSQSMADGEIPLKPRDEGSAISPRVNDDICQACRGRGTVEGMRCVVCGGVGKSLQRLEGG
ncbi:hypothetical protein N0A02_33525 (plasmid) [Paraburkholderia acidicola]|uniref:Uncharacterized protein n=1 Tax=Paraburkholderia acidicola TaxID=1912599 RepID=A0ABV1LZW9_9BURK